MNADVSPSEGSGKCLHYPEYIGRIEANLKHAPTFWRNSILAAQRCHELITLRSLKLTRDELLALRQ